MKPSELSLGLAFKFKKTRFTVRGLNDCDELSTAKLPIL